MTIAPPLCSILPSAGGSSKGYCPLAAPATVTVESEVGKGTTFRVSVPIARKKESEVTAPTIQLPVAGRRGRILVVDDEELVLRSVRRILSQEHDVLAMVSAEEALAVCAGGEVKALYRKRFLPNYGVFDEERFVEAGRSVQAFDTRWGRAALLICEDAWHSFTPMLAALDGAQVIIIPSASPARGVITTDDTAGRPVPSR